MPSSRLVLPVLQNRLEGDRGSQGMGGQGMGGLAKGLSVMEAFGHGRARLTIADVARLTGLDRATARRCLLTLESTGYAAFDGKFFMMTRRVLRLGTAYLAGTPLTAQLQPTLERLAETLSESCSASILDGTEIVYVARAAQRRVMSISLGVGSRLPAYCASMGRVLLAALPESEARALLERSDRKALTTKTLTDVDGLMQELARVRAEGYSLVDEELEIGLRSLAVPVCDAAGAVVAALNTGVQSGRAGPRRMIGDFLPRLSEAARALGLRL